MGALGLAFVVVASTLAASGVACAADCAPRAYLQSAINVATDGSWTVPVGINGTRKSFTISTGDMISSVRPALVQEFNLSRGIANHWLVDETGHVFQPAQVRVPDLQIGSMRGNHIRFLILEKGAEGVIAPDLLRRTDIELDYHGRMLRL